VCTSAKLWGIRVGFLQVLAVFKNLRQRLAAEHGVAATLTVSSAMSATAFAHNILQVSTILLILTQQPGLTGT
jgi:hypothetical protein